MTPSAHPKDIRAIAIGALLIILVGLLFIGRILFQEDAPLSPDGEIQKNELAAPSISPTDLQSRLSRLEGITLIDIRSPEAYNQEHLLHARLFSAPTLGTFVPENNNPVVIIDSTEDKAGREEARQIMAGKPYTYFFLEGGFEAWKSKSLPTVVSGDPRSFVDQAKVSFVSPAEAKNFLTPENNIFILDIQPANRFQEKHLKGATNIPLEELEKRFTEIPPVRQILVYGENELRSFQGGVRLFDLNFFAVRTLSGNATLSGGSGLPLEP